MPDCLIYSNRKPNGHRRQIRFNSTNFLITVSKVGNRVSYKHLSSPCRMLRLLASDFNTRQHSFKKLSFCSLKHLSFILVQSSFISGIEFSEILRTASYVVGIPPSGSQYDELSLSYFLYNIIQGWKNWSTRPGSCQTNNFNG